MKKQIKKPRKTTSKHVPDIPAAVSVDIQAKIPPLPPNGIRVSRPQER